MAAPHPLLAPFRAVLGTDILPRLERHMATITEALTALAEQVNAVSAAQASSFHNLQVAITTLKSGELSAEQQAAVDQIVKSLSGLADDAQKADDGYEPAQNPAGDVPADGTPVEGGDTPADTAPVDETPADDVPAAKASKR